MFKTNVRIFEQSRYARFIVKFQTPLPVRPHSSGAIHGWLEPTNLQFGRGGNVLNLITVNTLALLKRYSVCNRLHERIILRNEKVSWKKKKVVEMKYIFLRDFISTRKLALCIWYITLDLHFIILYNWKKFNFTEIRYGKHNSMLYIYIIYIYRVEIKFSTIF